MAELDFLCTVDNKIYPLEVKAGINPKSKSLKSYHQQLEAALRYQEQQPACSDKVNQKSTEKKSKKTRKKCDNFRYYFMKQHNRFFIFHGLLKYVAK